MQRSDQVAEEAREKLAKIVERWIKGLRDDQTAEFNLKVMDWRLVVAALRAQPERGAEEMAIKAFQERALEGIQNLRHAAACNFSREYSGSLGEARCDSFLEAYKVVRALPLHPAKDEGGGR